MSSSTPESFHITTPQPAPRTLKACGMCRQMKVKCDGAVPCTHCRTSFHGECFNRKFHRQILRCLDCVYPPGRRKRRKLSHENSSRIQDLEARLKLMEESHVHLTASNQSSEDTSRDSFPNQSTQFIHNDRANQAAVSDELPPDTVPSGSENDQPRKGDARVFAPPPSAHSFKECEPKWATAWAQTSKSGCAG